jgi:phage major head subunit gpT-like protein
MALKTSTAGWNKLLEPGLRKIFFETWKEHPAQFSKVFNVDKSNKHAEHDISLTGFGPWEKRTSENSEVPYDDPMEGFAVDYLHDEFLKGFKVTRAMVDDEMYNQINKLPRNLARAGRAKVETDAASVLNNGFANSGYDGEALFSNEHPLKRAGSSTGDNLIEVTDPSTSDDLLNEDTVNEAILKARKTTDDAGLKIVVSPKYIVVPPELEAQATRVVQSAQRPGTDWNDINTVRGKLQIIVMDYLTDPQAYFLVDPSVHQLNFFWRVKPEFKTEEDFDTLEAKYRGYMRYSVGYSDWRGVVGVHAISSGA